MLLTLTIWFSLYHKWKVSNGILFSLDHKLYVSDYDSDSDSATSETSLYCCLNFRHPFESYTPSGTSELTFFIFVKDNNNNNFIEKQ